MRQLKKIITQQFLTLIFIVSASNSYAEQELISLFPMQNYNQNISAWINKTNENFNKPLIDEEMRQKRFTLFYDQYFGARSPWNSVYVNQVLHQAQPNDLKTLEISILASFSNEGKSDSQIGYGANFRPYSLSWINNLKNKY